MEISSQGLRTKIIKIKLTEGGDEMSVVEWNIVM